MVTRRDRCRESIVRLKLSGPGTSNLLPLRSQNRSESPTCNLHDDRTRCEERPSTRHPTANLHLIMSLIHFTLSRSIQLTHLRRSTVLSLSPHLHRTCSREARKHANMRPPEDHPSPSDIYESFFRHTSRRWM